MHLWLFSKQGRKEGLKTSPVTSWFPTTANVKVRAQVGWRLQSCLFHKLAPGWSKGLAVRHRGNRGLKLHLSRVGSAITDAYTGNASGQAWVSDSGQATTACSKNHAKCPHQPLVFQQCSLRGWGFQGQYLEPMDWSSGLLSQQSGIWLYPQYGGDGHRVGEDPLGLLP